MMWTDIHLLALAVLLLAIGTAQMVLYHRFLARLRQEHPAHWKELGKPVMTLSLSSGWSSARATHRFLGRKGYEELQDLRLTRYAQWYRWLQVPSTLLFVLFMIVLLRSI